MTPLRALPGIAACLIAAPAALADNAVIFERLSHLEARVFVEGRPAQTPVYRYWKPICTGMLPAPSGDQLAQIVEQSKDLLRLDERSIEPGPPLLGRSQIPFDIEFNVIGTPPIGTDLALQTVETYFEDLFEGDLIDQTIHIDITFGPLGPDTLGVTTTLMGALSYEFVRDALIANMDGDDEIQQWLPEESLPVRFDGTTDHVTHVHEVYFNKATINVAFPDSVISGQPVAIVFNSDLAFDFDPANGVNPGHADFMSVASHEIMHALAFTTWADDSNESITQMDLFRFQWSANNPDSYESFRDTPRLVDNNVPESDAQTDLIDDSFRMSDGDPWQASHFLDAPFPGIGLMDPNLAAGQTRWPDFLSDSDLKILDAVGFDVLFGAVGCEADADGNGFVNSQDISFVIFRLGNTGEPGELEGDTDGNGVVSVEDLAFVIFRLGGGC